MPSIDPGLRCRLCTAPLSHPVWDLGVAPLANAYRRPSEQAPEPHYPLRLYLCERCTLVQLEAVASPASIFTDYAYFSSYSSTLLQHSEAFADAAIDRLGLVPGDLVVEVASNDGYLLQYFQRKGLEVVGVEPASNVADAAIAKGIPTDGAVLRLGDGAGPGIPGPAAAADRGQQRRGARARPQRLHLRARDAAGARRHDQPRVPLPAAPGAGRAVRHDLPRALPVLFAALDHGCACGRIS